MPSQEQIRKIAKAQGVSAEEASQRVFGRLRSLGWKPSREGGPTKFYVKKHSRKGYKVRKHRRGR